MLHFANHTLGRRLILVITGLAALLCAGLGGGVAYATRCSVFDYIDRASTSPRDHDQRYLFACGYVWHSADGGLVWRRVDPRGLPLGTRDGYIAVHADPGRLYLGTLITSSSSMYCWDCAWKNLRPAVYTSLDGGRSWAFSYKFKRGPAGEGGFVGLFIDPAKDNFVYAVIKNADEVTFYASGTSGQFWKEMCTEYYAVGRSCKLPQTVDQFRIQFVGDGIDNVK
jgi:hypothetical protein